MQKLLASKRIIYNKEHAAALKQQQTTLVRSKMKSINKFFAFLPLFLLKRTTVGYDSIRTYVGTHVRTCTCIIIIFIKVFIQVPHSALRALYVRSSIIKHVHQLFYSTYMHDTYYTSQSVINGEIIIISRVKIQYMSEMSHHITLWRVQ